MEEKEEKVWVIVYMGFNLNIMIACGSLFWS